MKSTLFLVFAVSLFFPEFGLVAQTGTGTSTASGAHGKSKGAATATDGLKSTLSTKATKKDKKKDADSDFEMIMRPDVKPAKGTEEAVQNAVRNNGFTLQNGKEYKLDKAISLENTTSNQPVSIEYQVGNIDQKPAFVTVLVDSKEAPTKPEDAEKIFGAKLSGPVQVAGTQSTLSACGESRVCVETGTVNQKEVCVRWKCISK